MMRRFFPLLRVSLLAAGPGATNAVCQQSGGASLEGSVHGPDGKAVPNASVRITATATGYGRTVATRADGRFVAPLLPVGRYSLEVTASGFMASKRDGVVLRVGATQTVDISGLVISGGRPINSNVSIDGADFNGPLAGQPASCSRRAFRVLRDR